MKTTKRLFRLLVSLLTAVVINAHGELQEQKNEATDGFMAGAKLALMTLGLLPAPIIGEPRDALDVIGVGLSRTGTTSLEQALKILGYKTYHGKDIILQRHELLIMDGFREGDPASIEKYLREVARLGYDSAVDFPQNIYYKEALKLFPEAKFVLTARDPVKWVQSMESVERMMRLMAGRPFSFFSELSLYKLPMQATSSPFSYTRHGCVQGWDALQWYQPWFAPWISYPTAEPHNVSGCVRLFEEHLEEVRRSVPGPRLLEMRVGEGWGPLCGFLGVPVPDRPFPSANSGKQMDYVYGGLLIVAHGYPFIILAMVGLLVMVARKCCGNGCVAPRRKEKQW